jgi:acetyl esterase/lipase
MSQLRSFIVATLVLTASAFAAEPSRDFTYKKTPEAELKLFVSYPPGWKATDKRPGIVFFFGGGWTSGDVKQFAMQAEYLASRGMVAVRADYRVKSRHKVDPDKCVSDAKSAVRWVRQHASELGIDPNKIVASGVSAGGHLAACTALTDGLDEPAEDAKISSKPNALVLFNPVLNFTSADNLMQRLNNNEKLSRQISPTLHLKKDSPPTLILFGTADRLMAQGDEFVKKAKELGHRAEMYTAADQPHGFFNRSPWRERTISRMDVFLASLDYLQGKPTIRELE